MEREMTVPTSPMAHFKAQLHPNQTALSIAEKVTAPEDRDPVADMVTHLSDAEANAVMGVLWHGPGGEYLLPDIGEAIGERNREDLMEAIQDAIWRLQWVYAAMDNVEP
jgi:hypothetical protein